MKSKSNLLFIAGLFVSTLFGQKNPTQNNHNYNSVPAEFEYCKININGKSILPSGRYVSPVGDLVRISRAPFGLSVNDAETKAVVLHNSAISLIDLNQTKLLAQRFPEYDNSGTDILHGASFIGTAFGNDKLVYLSGGDKGVVWSFDVESKRIVDSIDCNLFQDQKGECFLTDICIDKAKQEIWILDRAWQVVYRVNLVTKKLIAKIAVGRIPFGLSLSSDNKHVVVVNVGIYNYPLLPGITPKNKDSFYLHFPPYGADTKESREGVEIEGRKIPGLGSPNNDESMSAWIIDVKSNKVSAKIKMGVPIGSFIDEVEVVGGSHPNSVVCDGNLAYISQTQLDEIAVLDIQKRKIIKRIPIQTNTFLDSTKGYFPYGLDIDKTNKRLFVSLLGYNAVCVIDLKSNKCAGFIPGGWGVSRVKYLNKSNQIVFTSIRGLGAGPNGGKGFKAPPQGSYIGDIQLGLFQKVTLGGQALMDSFSKICLKNTVKQSTTNSVNSFDKKISAQSPIQHIVYITKENRTFDEMFGQIKEVNGDSSLSRFGIRAEQFVKDQILNLPNAVLSKYGFDTLQKERFLNSLDNLKVAPNHLKIAKQFSVSDNFYCDSDASIHGHHWMMGTIPNEYVETNSANAGGFRLFSPAKGRRFPRTTGAQDPEDYNLTGGLWEALDRNHVSVYNFGEANEYTDVQEEWYDTLNGTALAVPFPMPKAIYSRTSRNYAGYNTSIPDQFRVEQFETEFSNLWLNGKDTMPQIITIQLPNDHTSGPRPADGYPMVQSYVADNDLALGRMLQFLSHTPYWKNMLVIVTEDDPQGGVDHIDAHRSVLLLAGPYVKKKYVSHKHANFGSIIRTIYHMNNIKPVNHFDATATLLDDFFTDTPDFTPYTLEKSDVRVFDPEVAMKKYNRSIPWREIKMSEPMDSEKEIKKSMGNEK